MILDRTNWKFGKTDINILVLSVAYEDIAIPLYYELLDHKGNSDSQIRIKLMQKFISNFGKNRIGCLLGDREFIGSHWLSWLDNQQISYAIGVRNNLLATASNGGETKVSNLFRSVGVHEHKTLKSKQKLKSSSVYLSGARSSDGELLIIASNSNNIADLVSMYGIRWEIENLFQALKTRGFNFEDTHLTDKNKIAKLMALISIAFVWAHKVGEYRDAKIQKITPKKHGRPQNSYFRYGLDMIVNAIQKIGSYSNDFSLCLKIFNKTTKELKI
ncbi:IS4 family transposase [Francisella philomiragia]|uniref:IS4 family transposase n=1 Tax=Francisella philomiragia TaxID=28110 RepID=UPI001F233EB1|nr:IS4 family transposase [Francisella philomiragia]